MESNPNLLPPYVSENAKKIVKTSKLHDEIKEFLLDENEI